jgi:hypothetical protein
MKTVVSIPDGLFNRVERLAKRTSRSRSDGSEPFAIWRVSCEVISMTLNVQSGTFQDFRKLQA